MSLSPNSASFSSKEIAFIKWHLNQQKQIYIIMSIILSPILIAAFSGLTYAIQDEIKWFETTDYVVLFGGLSVIIILMYVVVRFISQKISTEFPQEKIEFSGIYHTEKVATVTSGVDTFAKTTVIVHKIGDYIFLASDVWKFTEGEFYEVVAAPVKFSVFEARLYGEKYQCLLLTRECKSQELNIENDVDLGLLKTRTGVNLAILVLSIFLYAPGFLAYSLSTSELLNQILIGSFIVLTSICFGAILKLLKQRKILKRIRAFHNE